MLIDLRGRSTLALGSALVQLFIQVLPVAFYMGAGKQFNLEECRETRVYYLSNGIL